VIVRTDTLDRSIVALVTLQREMQGSQRSSASLGSSGLTTLIGPSAPHLAIFTVCLLLLLYGYEIFNFSLSIDEEVFDADYSWLGYIASGSWATGLLARVFPPIGNIPMVSTILFCAGLGLSACILARLLFRDHGAQWAFVAIFVSSPIWPHLAEFNISSWAVGICSVLLTFSVLFFLAEGRFGYIWATCLLAAATGISPSMYFWFLAVIFVLQLSIVLGTAPVSITDRYRTLPFLRVGLIAAAGLLGYFVVGKLLMVVLSLQMSPYVQGFVRLADFIRAPRDAIHGTLRVSLLVVSGSAPLYLGYGHLLTLLPLLGLLIAIVRVVGRGRLTSSRRMVAGVSLAAALVISLCPIVISAGSVSTRALTSWIPVSTFLAGLPFSIYGRFRKPLFGVLACVLFASIWVTVGLFYTDHIARQRDELLAARLMTRIDQILPNPPARIPFVVIGAVPAPSSGPFHRMEVFGDSFFDNSHEGGNPWRIAAYLRILGVDNLEPRELAEINPYRPVVKEMPVWPAAGSVEMVGGILVIKLGPMPPP